MPEHKFKISPNEERADLLEEYLEDLKDDGDLMRDQREKANIDMRFIHVSGGMWEDLYGTDTQNRTLMELDLISPYVQRFINDWNMNRVGVNFEPDNLKTSEDDADLMNGIYRADFRDNSGKMAVDNAVDEAAKCGYGCWKLATVQEDDEDPGNQNQRIEFRPINESHNLVIWDASSTRIDKADARRCTVLTPYTKKAFEKEYPDITPMSAYEPYDLRYLNFDGETANELYIATRYEVVKRKETVYVYNNYLSEEVEVYTKEEHEKIKDELADDPAREFKEERKVIRRRVFKSVFTGSQFIENPRRIAGKYIPIIPVYGYRGYSGGMEWYRGLVRKLIDAQRIFNFVISKLAEISASSGQKLPILTEEQVRGHEDSWADRDNLSYLLLNELKDEQGVTIQNGPIGYLEPAALDQNTEALLRIVLEIIREITGGDIRELQHNPQLSGVALQKVFKRMDANTQEIQDNIANAVEWGGKVYQAIASEVYNTPRMVRAIGLDGSAKLERLQSVVMDEETGSFVEANRLHGKKFRVYSDIGPQYETQREEEVEKLKGVGEMVKGTSMEPQYMPVIIAGIIDKLSLSKRDPLKVLNRRMLLAQGAVEPETDEEKQLVEQMKQPQPDPQQELVQAAAAQALGEAERAKAEARNLDAKSLVNVADAEKKTAETAEIMASIEDNRAKTLAELRREFFEGAQALPF